MAQQAKLSGDRFVYEGDALQLVSTIRRGINVNDFDKIAGSSPFSMAEWSVFLHLSQRTMQRIRKEKRAFEPLQSERILQIALLYRKGIDVFGSKEKFDSWLEAENVTLRKVKPKSLLDNAFGINLLFDELTRIEHGVLA